MLIVWFFAAQALPPYQLPGPIKVGDKLAWLVATPAGLWHVAASIFHVAAAMLASFVLGFFVALLPLYLPVAVIMVDGRFTPFVNSFPGIGWTMLAIVWLGIGTNTVVFSVTIILLPFMIINLREGVRALDRELMEMAGSFSRSRARAFRLIILPSLFPFMFSAMRVSFGVSWKVTLTAELLGGTTGLGYLMNVARQELDTAQIFAVMLLIVLLVYAINRLLFDTAQRHLQLGRVGAAS